MDGWKIVLPALMSLDLKFVGFTQIKLNFGEVKSFIKVKRCEAH